MADSRFEMNGSRPTTGGYRAEHAHFLVRKGAMMGTTLLYDGDGGLISLKNIEECRQNYQSRSNGKCFPDNF